MVEQAVSIVLCSGAVGDTTMIRQLKAFNASRLHLAGRMELAAAKYVPQQAPLRPVDAGADRARRFPPRPDTTVISEAIALYYITQNENGFWLARAANCKDGGLFFLKRSAVRFAKKKSGSAGCATMFLAGALELDVPNEGGAFAALLDSAIDAIARRFPTIGTFVRMAGAEWRQLIAEISRVKASERRHREAIERELFRGHYTLASKNDDDLPIPQPARAVDIAANTGEFQ